MKHQKHFKVGSFNLYNLVLPGKRFHGKKGYSKDHYEKKINWIGRQLDRMQASIVGFQEVFHEEAFLEALRHSEYLKDAHTIVASPTGDLPRVAIASHFPILEHEIIEEFPTVLSIEDTEVPIRSFSRPVLKAKLKINDQLAITVYVVHLKSKRPMLESGESRKNPIDSAKGQARSLIRRAAEATALREVLMKDLLNRDTPVIVLGDVNDSGLAVTTRIVSGEPPHRKFPHDVKQKIWDVLLYHVKDIQARQSYQDFYFSHIHNGHHEALDHIMVSQELVRENPKHVGSIGWVNLLNDHLIDETLSEDRIEFWESDHGQVVASVELI